MYRRLCSTKLARLAGLGVFAAVGLKDARGSAAVAIPRASSITCSSDRSVTARLAGIISHVFH